MTLKKGWPVTLAGTPIHSTFNLSPFCHGIKAQLEQIFFSLSLSTSPTEYFLLYENVMKSCCCTCAEETGSRSILGVILLKFLCKQGFQPLGRSNITIIVLHCLWQLWMWVSLHLSNNCGTAATQLCWAWMVPKMLFLHMVMKLPKCYSMYCENIQPVLLEMVTVLLG